jgi:hypothetical protein
VALISNPLLPKKKKKKKESVLEDISLPSPLGAGQRKHLALEMMVDDQLLPGYWFPGEITFPCAKALVETPGRQVIFHQWEILPPEDM